MDSVWLPESDQDQIRIDVEHIDETYPERYFDISSYADAKYALSFLEENRELLKGIGFQELEYDEYDLLETVGEYDQEVTYLRPLLRTKVIFDVSWERLFDDIFRRAVHKGRPSINEVDIKELYAVEQFSLQYHDLLYSPDSLREVAEIGLERLHDFLDDIDFDYHIANELYDYWKENILPQRLEGNDIDEDYLYEIWRDSEEYEQLWLRFEAEGLRDLNLDGISQALHELLLEEMDGVNNG